MAVTVRFPGGFEATIDGYEWTSKDERLASVLNGMLSPGGAGGEDPDPDRTAALEAVEKLGAEIVASDDEDGEYEEDEIF